MAEPIDNKAHIRMISEALQGILGTPAPLHEAASEEEQAEEFGKGKGILQISWIEKKGTVKSVYADSSSSDSARLSKADIQALVKLLNELQRKMA